MNNMTQGQVSLRIRELEKKAETKGWKLVRKPGGSVPVSKCPLCGCMSVLTFFKDVSNGMELYDVCMHNKSSGTKHCRMIHCVFVHHNNWNVPKYRHFSTQTFVAYGAATEPQGIHVLYYR